MPKRKSATSQARHQSISAASAEVPTPTEAENQPISTAEHELEMIGYVEWRVEESREEVDAKLTELDYRLFQLEHGQHPESSEFDRDCFVDHEPVAEFLGTSVQGLRRLMVDGLPYHRLSPRVTRFRKSEIIKWVHSRP